jgi:hypothetical protein
MYKIKQANLKGKEQQTKAKKGTQCNVQHEVSLISHHPTIHS